MTEHRMQRLFAALEEAPIEPDPQFIARLRRRVHDVATGEPGASIETIDESIGEAIMVMLKTDEPRSDQRSKMRLRIAAGALAAATVAIVVGLWAATNDGDETLVASEPEATENAENIVGIWHRISSDPMYIRFLEDGTMNFAESPEKVSEGLGDQWKYRVEGTQFFVEEIRGQCETLSVAPALSDRPPASTGTYEVRLLENGNLQFVVIEDECRARVTFLYGRPDDGIIREFEPVP